MTRQSDYTTIYAMGRTVGSVKDGVFSKTIKENQYLKYPVKSIAFDVQSLEDAEQAGANRVQVKDTQSGVIWTASIAQIWRVGVRFNRGYGNQISLPLSGFSRRKPGGGLQLELFQGVGV